MKNIKIKKEEFDTSRVEIAKAESLWENNFPKDYVEFLLQNNGAIVYPNWPNLGPENKTEIWGIERFLSVGDIILQKHDQIPSARIEIEERHFKDYNLSRQNILIFAQGERGVYFFNLAKEEYGQIYIANFAGGNGISKTSAKSFNEFISSLGVPEWEEEEIDESFEFSIEFGNWLKVFQRNMFYTPSNPELGLQRFKEVFEFAIRAHPRDDGYPTIIQKYVDERLKLDYLLKKGCNTEGLLISTKRAKTVQYLVENLNLDINKRYNNKYPLQHILSEGHGVQFVYEEFHKILEMGIELNWDVKGKLFNGEVDLPMIEKLGILHEKYNKLKIEEQEFQIKYKRPSGRSPFIESFLIEEKLGIRKH